MSRRLLAIVNPASGGGRAVSRWESLRKKCQAFCSLLDVAYTEKPAHAIRMARSAADHFDAVVAVGGDGTVSEVANGLLESGCSVPLGVLPVGTANDGAMQFGIASVADGLAALAYGTPRHFDTIEVRHQQEGQRVTRHALMFAAVGFGAELIAQTTARVKRLFGPRLCYAVGFLKALLHYRRCHMEAHTDQGDFTGALFHVCAGNTEYAGGHSMRLSPGAVPDDEQLNLCVVERLSRLEALLHLPKLIRGTHPTHPKVRYFNGTRLEVRSEPPTPLVLDGDVIGCTPATLTICPHALPVLVRKGVTH